MSLYLRLTINWLLSIFLLLVINVLFNVGMSSEYMAMMATALTIFKGLAEIYDEEE